MAVVDDLILPDDQKARFNTWLEKQKVLFESGRGLYYYDGEKTTYCGYPATEDNPYDFAMSQQKEQKPVETSDFKTKLADYLQNNSPKDGQYVISSESILEMAKEELIKRGVVQKPVELSEFDKGALKDAICATDILGNDESFNKGNPNLGKAFRVAKDWLKSLPERFNLTPKREWSEEDEKIKERLITRLNWITHNTRTDGTSPNITFFDEIAWLKSLRPQWKPTEEQMKALNWARCLIFETYTDKHIATEPYHILGELYDQLKQLKDGNGTVHP